MKLEKKRHRCQMVGHIYNPMVNVPYQGVGRPRIERRGRPNKFANLGTTVVDSEYAGVKHCLNSVIIVAHVKRTG